MLFMEAEAHHQILLSCNTTFYFLFDRKSSWNLTRIKAEHSTVLSCVRRLIQQVKLKSNLMGVSFQILKRGDSSNYFVQLSSDEFLFVHFHLHSD